MNGKYCDVKVRLPRDLASLENEAIRRVKARLARGGIDVSVRRSAGKGADLAPTIDLDLASQYAESFRALRDRVGLQGDLALADLLGAQGVVSLEERAPDLDAAARALERALDEALDGLVAMREREGGALRADLESRMAKVAALADEVERESPLSVEATRARVEARLAELMEGISVDPQRLAQELAFLAERADITEELTRLRSHVDQFLLLLDAAEPSGRRMDFLLQEFNREVNTIASKAQWAPIANLSVELKAELERIREQVQNVE